MTWQISDKENTTCISIVDSSGRVVARLPLGPTDLSNARIIAAAPAMLEALEGLLKNPRAAAPWRKLEAASAAVSLAKYG